MHILFVTPYPPSRIRARSFGFINQLAREHHISVLCLCTNTREMLDAKELVKQGIHVQAYQETKFSRYSRCLLALLTGTTIPLQVIYATMPRLREAVHQQIASGMFDLVHIEFIRALGLLPAQLTVPVVWDAVDCVSNLYTLGVQHSTTPMLHILGGREALLVRNYEHQQLQRFHHILVTAEREKQGLLSLSYNGEDVEQKYPYANITVLPLGIDTHYFQPMKKSYRSDYLVFSGKMSFHANIAGALHLVKNIMPHIWRKRPHIRVIIAGSAPPPTIRRLATDKRIEITGYVDDLRPYIAQARIAVCPLPYAVGAQYKVLEAMALGTPVVASTGVAAGIQAIAGQDLLVADDPQEFAAHVLQLFDNQLVWENLALRGSHYVQTHHNWNLLIERLLAVYRTALEESK